MNSLARVWPWRGLAGLGAVFCLAMVVAGCATPQAAPEPPKSPWRVSHCGANNSVEVRIASRIPTPDLKARCESEWRDAFLRVSVRFDGAFGDELLAVTTWYDGNGKVIPLENTFDRKFNLGYVATRTEVWRSPVIAGRGVRIDVSCVSC